MLSKIVDDDEKGKVFAFIAAIQNVVMFLGSMAFLSIYTASATWFPGLAFEVVAALQVIAGVIFITLLCKYRNEAHHEQPVGFDSIDDD
jgi:membrane protein YdbS with pleckstrin-like domain